MARVSVIVPGAGSGERFGGGRNKIFAKIHGKAMFLHTLEAFTRRDDVCQTLFVCSAADMEELKDRFGGHLGFMGVTVVAGGDTRSQSVRNALAKVANEAELVCVHDAARPCLAGPWIDAVFAEADKSGAAILAVPIHGTLKEVKQGDIIERTVPRDQFDNIHEAQTPQVFRKDILQQAYESPKDATDDAAMVEALGLAVSVVPGDPRNVKVTTQKDLAFAAAVIKTLPKPKENRPLHPFAETQW